MNILVFKKLKIILNKIDLICSSVGLTDNCIFNPTETTNYINSSQSIKEAIEILDSKIKELDSKITAL